MSTEFRIILRLWNDLWWLCYDKPKLLMYSNAKKNWNHCDKIVWPKKLHFHLERQFTAKNFDLSLDEIENERNSLSHFSCYCPFSSFGIKFQFSPKCIGEHVLSRFRHKSHFFYRLLNSTHTNTPLHHNVRICVCFFFVQFFFYRF